MPDEGATSEAWYDAYEQVYAALPEHAAVRCPSCGQDALRIAFTGRPGDRVGFASFWCDNCRTGIHLSRVAVPGGVEIVPIDLPAAERAQRVPNYTIIPPPASGEGEIA